MSKRRLLVVDDDDAIREIAQISLQMIGGWETLTAASGTEAITRAAQEQPDAILLDVMMPGLDGPATLARLQDQPATRDITVILLTAKVQPAERARFTALPGVSGVIAKPFDPEQLPGQVADLAGWPR